MKDQIKLEMKQLEEKYQQDRVIKTNRSYTEQDHTYKEQIDHIEETIKNNPSN